MALRVSGKTVLGAAVLGGAIGGIGGTAFHQVAAKIPGRFIHDQPFAPAGAGALVGAWCGVWYPLHARLMAWFKRKRTSSRATRLFLKVMLDTIPSTVVSTVVAYCIVSAAARTDAFMISVHGLGLPPSASREAAARYAKATAELAAGQPRPTRQYADCPTQQQLEAWGAWVRQMESTAAPGSALHEWGPKDVCTSTFYPRALARAAHHPQESPLRDPSVTRQALQVGGAHGLVALDARRQALSQAWYMTSTGAWWPLWLVGSAVAFFAVPPPVRPLWGVLQWSAVNALAHYHPPGTHGYAPPGHKPRVPPGSPDDEGPPEASATRRGGGSKPSMV